MNKNILICMLPCVCEFPYTRKIRRRKMKFTTIIINMGTVMVTQVKRANSVSALWILLVCLAIFVGTFILAHDEVLILRDEHHRHNALRPAPCATGYFECDSGDYCVQQRFNCDHQNDCPDGSDEFNCTDNDDHHYYNKLFSKRPDEDREKSFRNCSLWYVPSGCSCSGHGLFCVGQDFVEVPRHLPNGTTVLDLSGNRITSIGNNSFTRRSRQLKSLIMTSNNITRLDVGAFTNLIELTHLHLVGNRLTTIHSYVFRNNTKLILLNLSYNPIRHIGRHAFAGLVNLAELDLRSCQLLELRRAVFEDLHNLDLLWLQENQIRKLADQSLMNLWRLDTLSLEHNQLATISSSVFVNVTNLKSLSLAHNHLVQIVDHQFESLPSLTKLDLSFNRIESIAAYAFDDLRQLRSLALQGNPFEKLPSNVFAELKELTHIYFSHFQMCHYAREVRVCTPRGDGISSVQHLLDNVILRVAVWMVAFIAITGNCLVIIGRMMMQELNAVHSFFIKNLALADLLMGVYLLVIAYYDIRFRDHYIIHEERWRHSWQCTFAGVISTISSESSVFILAIITVDRYWSVMQPLSTKRHTMGFAVMAMLAVWITAVLLALFPLLARGHFQHRFYGNNGVCLGLQIDDHRGWSYSLFLFCGLNSLAFMFIMYAYVKMSTRIMHSAIGLRATHQQQDRGIAKRCAFIVATDGICWLPIVTIKLAAVCGISIDQDLYAWVAVFLLPVNSALNPVLYTLTTKLFKQQIHRIIQHSFTSSAMRHSPPPANDDGDSSSSSSYCSLTNGKIGENGFVQHGGGSLNSHNHSHGHHHHNHHHLHTNSLPMEKMVRSSSSASSAHHQEKLKDHQQNNGRFFFFFGPDPVISNSHHHHHHHHHHNRHNHNNHHSHHQQQQQQQQQQHHSNNHNNHHHHNSNDGTKPVEHIPLVDQVCHSQHQNSDQQQPVIISLVPSPSPPPPPPPPSPPQPPSSS